MRFYECTVILRPELARNQVDQVISDLNDLIAANGGSIGNNEYWGLRTLAYPINKQNRAHYAYFHISMPASSLAEVDRKMKINEDIMRFLIVKVDTLDEAPSAMMQARYRDEQRQKHDDYDSVGAE